NTSDSDNDSAGSGGGIHIASGVLELDHSIVALNFDNTAVAPDIAGSPTVAQFNLIGTNAGSSLIEAPVSSADANGNLVGGPLHGPIDPLLHPLAHNGGPTPTHTLRPGSPAIDRGDAALEPGVGGVPEFDQRGAPYTRLAGNQIDIGTFELQSRRGALTADFNFDGVTDGRDFLTWQRELGRPSPTIRHGDSTADGDVDGSDLDVWKARFGEMPSQRSSREAYFSLEASYADELASKMGAFLAGLTLPTEITPSFNRGATLLPEQIYFEFDLFETRRLARRTDRDSASMDRLGSLLDTIAAPVASHESSGISADDIAWQSLEQGLAELRRLDF
ncbi:MAG TPA: choice-of-anchor Q domain-containing protein, partial [Lacipirellula sp.]